MVSRLAQRVQSRLDALNTTAYAASMKATGGASKDIINNILVGKTINPRADTMRKIAEALDVSVEWLLQDDSESPPVASEPPSSNVRIAPPQNIKIDRLNKNLPVLGTAAGSLAGAFQFEGGVIEYVARPASLSHVPDAYAIYVEGDSMYPAHPHGEMRIVHPHKPPQIGDTVVIVATYSKDGEAEAFIKKLVKRTGEKLIVEQFNPPMTIEFTRDYVKSCHKVLTLNEILGF